MAVITHSDQERWSTLRQALGVQGLLFTATSPGGVARGTVAIDDGVATILEILDEEVGAAPAEIDIVAYGVSGLAARLYVHVVPSRIVRRLVLLGTPNLGTPRALVESRSDVGLAPLPGGIDSPESALYKAAIEQTESFLAAFNDRVSRRRGTQLWLVAGEGGNPDLERVLGCDRHDNRVCVESVCAAGVLGVGPDCRARVVPEDHDALGRGNASLELLIEEIGLGKVVDLPQGVDPDVVLPGDAMPIVQPLEAGDGGVAGDPEVEALSLGKVITGKMPPGGTGLYKFASDTSDSVVIILNTVGDLGGLEFSFLTPAGDDVTIQNHNEFSIDYFSYAEGEGTGVQIFSLPSSTTGEYFVSLSNPPENDVVSYSLELRLDSPISLKSDLASDDIELGTTTLLTSEIEHSDLLPPEVALSVTARVIRPDGTLELVDLVDDGTLGDAVAGDGIYATTVTAGSQPGYHTIEILATGEEESYFERAATVPLLVRSDIAQLGAQWQSGADDVDSDTLKDILWVDGSVVPQRAGTVVVLGHLTRDGESVARAGALVDLADGDDAEPFRLEFDGYDIYGSERDGPYRLSEVEVLDAAIGFVRATIANDVLETEPWSWTDFSMVGGLPFVRGDSNGDHLVDLSDGVHTLQWLFVDRETEFLCLDAADVDADGDIELSDPVVLFAFLYLGAPPPAFPFPDCDQDQDLGCEYYPFCQ